MRKWIYFLLLLVVFLGFYSCSTPTSPLDKRPKDKIHVLSTTSIIDNIVAKIGKDRIFREVLIAQDLDPHSYELVKGDDEKFFNACIIFANGLGLEHGASLRYQLEHHHNVLFLGEEIRSLAPNSILDVDGQVDPHIWMDVGLWKKAVMPIANALSKMDPEGEKLYLQNALELEEQMEVLDREIKTIVQAVSPEKRYIVSTHDAFQYFAKTYLSIDEEKETLGWKNRFASPEGIAPEGQLSAIDIRTIVEYLQRHQVRVLFPESNVNQDSLIKIKSVCEEMGMLVRISPSFLYSDSLGGIKSPASDYFSMMRYNAEVLCRELPK